MYEQRYYELGSPPPPWIAVLLIAALALFLILVGSMK